MRQFHSFARNRCALTYTYGRELGWREAIRIAMVFAESVVSGRNGSENYPKTTLRRCEETWESHTGVDVHYPWNCQRLRGFPWAEDDKVAGSFGIGSKMPLEGGGSGSSL